MFTQKDYFGTFLGNLGPLRAGAAILLVATRTLALPLLAISRTNLGVRFMGPASAAVAVALLAVMQFTFMILFTIVGTLLMGPAAFFTGGSTAALGYSPVVFDAFSRAVFVVLIAQLALAHLREHRGERIHTRSSGYPWLAYACSFYLLGSLGTRLFAEPLLWFLIARAAGQFDMVLGLYLKLAACALMVVNFLEYAQLKETERDYRDADIENELYKQIRDGEAEGGTYHRGVPLPDIGRAAYAEKVREHEEHRRRYGPGEHPALDRVRPVVAADDMAADFAEEARRDRERLLDQLDQDICDRRDGDGDAAAR